jgi:ribosomal protein S12 methylthiotransferase
MSIAPTTLPDQKTIGMVSLGCPKALVDSERILTRLRADGYAFAEDYAGADVVLVNTCGFLDSAKEESLAAIGEAIAENGRVIVTGCMGEEADAIRAAHPQVLAITGAHQYEQVVEAVHTHAPPSQGPFIDLIPQMGDLADIKLTPRHYSYLKISEGCNHSCAFCIIPSLRGKLASRRIDACLREAEKLVAAGTRELLIISQDTSAYGVDIRHESRQWNGRDVRAHMTDLARELGGLRTPEGRAPWVRLHYVYPYPHVDQVIPLMAEGLLTPYLDIPFQHASPKVLKLMRRPANEAKVLERLKSWRAICPDIAIRSSFVVGFPGETEEDFEILLDFLQEMQFDRVGAFTYSAQEGTAAANMIDDVPDEVKHERLDALQRVQSVITAERYERHIGRTVQLLIDRAGSDDELAVARAPWQADDIDGVTHVDTDAPIGSLVEATITDVVDDYDFEATATGIVLLPPAFSASQRSARTLPLVSSSMGSFGR